MTRHACRIRRRRSDRLDVESTFQERPRLVRMRRSARRACRPAARRAAPSARAPRVGVELDPIVHVARRASRRCGAQSADAVQWRQRPDDRALHRERGVGRVARRILDEVESERGLHRRGTQLDDPSAEGAGLGRHLFEHAHAARGRPRSRRRSSTCAWRSVMRIRCQRTGRGRTAAVTRRSPRDGWCLRPRRDRGAASGSAGCCAAIPVARRRARYSTRQRAAPPRSGRARARRSDR